MPECHVVTLSGRSRRVLACYWLPKKCPTLKRSTVSTQPSWRDIAQLSIMDRTWNLRMTTKEIRTINNVAARPAMLSDRRGPGSKSNMASGRLSRNQPTPLVRLFVPRPFLQSI
jgi:hypothetical protein